MKVEALLQYNTGEAVDEAVFHYCSSAFPTRNLATGKGNMNVIAQQEQDISLSALDQYLRQVRLTPNLRENEEEQLLRCVKQGTDAGHALDRLVAGYQPLLLGLARRFARRCRALELLDLVQEGNEGLLRALEKYDETIGVAAFRTFAFTWIRTTMLVACWQYEDAIRLPLHKVRAIRKMGAVTVRLLSELGREPTVAETAQAMEMKERDVRELAVLQMQQVVSLQAFSPDDEDEGVALEEVIADPATTTGNERRGYSVEEALSALPERERIAIRLRFGFEDGQAYTQKEVAALLGVTLSTLVALERRAQKRLRALLCA